MGPMYSLFILSFMSLCVFFSGFGSSTPLEITSDCSGRDASCDLELLQTHAVVDSNSGPLGNASVQPSVYEIDKGTAGVLEVCRKDFVSTRWSVGRAQAWFKRYGWIVGANFIPSTAVNSLEMWQSETFDEITIDRELGFAKGLGMSVVRVFLHDLAFKNDSAGFLQRMEQFLTIAASHGIASMFVLFDGCWRPDAQAGTQPAPLPRLHNSQWLQAPSKRTLEAESQWDALKGYVQDVIGRFRNDDRVHSWDLYNEVDNTGTEAGMANRVKIERTTTRDVELRQRLMCQSFAWARDVLPSQPLHASEWGGMNDSIRLFLRNVSDIGNFHSYDSRNETEQLIEEMKRSYADRPLVMTEYMARPFSTLESILPLAYSHKVGALSWGLVRGKTNTVWPWSSWETHQVEAEPSFWFHDILWPNGTAYDSMEVATIRNITGSVSQATSLFSLSDSSHAS